MSDRQRLVLAGSIVVAFAVTAVAATTATESPPSQTAPSLPVVQAVVQPVAASPSADVESQLDAMGDDDSAALQVPSRTEAPPIADVTSIPREADLLAHAFLTEDGRLAVGPKTAPRVLTVEPSLQKRLTGILESYQTPYGAVVVMEPKTGRVLAMAEHSQARPNLRGLPVKAVFPAASVFKLVTASALLDEGVEPDDTECARFAKRKISEKNLLDSAKGALCFSMSHALALSRNGIFARLTIKHLTPQKLLSWAEKLHFNQAIPFAEPADMSLAAVPEEQLPFARTGAGFGDVFLSPLHGATLASAIANQGLWQDPVLIEDAPRPDPVRVMSETNASKLADMMEETVTLGTARKIFRQRGFRVPGAVGKTGTLADKKPFRDYSWFVGFAPKDDPKVAVAAVIVNDPYWRIRATWLGREAMRIYLEDLHQQELAEKKKASRDLARVP